MRKKNSSSTENMSGKEKGKYNMSANYTVEASFIVPIILGLIFAMIYMLFILHDKVILQENLQTEVICIADKEIKTAGDKTENKKNVIAVNNKIINKKDIAKNMIILKVTNLTCNVGHFYITAEADTVSRLDIPVITYFMNRKKKISIKTRYLNIRPESMVRKRQQYDN